MSLLNVTIALPGAKQAMNMFELLLKGGWIMLPLFLLSILSLYIIVERILGFRKHQSPNAWIEKIEQTLLDGTTEAIRPLCEHKTNGIAKVLVRGLESIAMPPKAIEFAMENVGKKIVYQLEKNLALLGTIATVAPMLGFLGTVTGMIQAFIAMSQATEHVSPKLLSSGIYEAMITTATGLVVGIIAYLGYNYFITRIQSMSYEMEATASSFLETLEREKLKKNTESSVDSSDNNPTNTTTLDQDLTDSFFPTSEKTNEDKSEI